jgi:nucleoside-diphosphate-sugar epimerase
MAIAPGHASARARSHRMTRRRVVVTGAGGFVGGHLVDRFVRAGWDAVALVRTGGSAPRPQDGVRIVETDLTRSAALLDVLREGDVVVHLAGRAHVMHDQAPDPGAAFRAANVVPTETLCESSSRVGVARFVFMSSAKVFGEGRERPYAVTDPMAPADPYARSKAEAERVVGQAGERGTFAWTILRPPFVYGPGGKGNFPRLVTLARFSTRVPLPLASIENRRSVVFVGNLVDLILHAVQRPESIRRVLLPTDAEDVSTPELLRAIAVATSSRARLFRCPPVVLRTAARLIGRSAEMDRLTESLRLDSRHLREELGWEPPFSLRRALALSVDGSGRPSAVPAHG